ncbi:MAG: hypothetical protein IJP23_03095 [Oscillospiraceae bacterium]|nr:hypothetical protein [Oscillospiraceae bacterium]
MKNLQEEKQLQNRLLELADRADRRGGRTFSEFLDMAGQDVASRLKTPVALSLEGGWPGAERRVVCFGERESWQEEWEAAVPVACLKISAAAPKFSEKLTHRDFLGALMGLGFRREVLGDVIVSEKGDCAWLFCLESVADYICDQLTQVRRTTVKVSRETALPDFASELPQEQTVNAASARADAMVAGVYNLSRSESGELFRKELVYINYRLASNPSAELKENDLVSVRGYGRFIYCGAAGETRSGRLRARVRVF